jgi:hypothetical protein
LDGKTGQVKASYQAAEPILTSPVIADGVIYFGGVTHLFAVK